MSGEVNTYLSQFPDETRGRLETLRGLVAELCPTAVESMNYGLIGYKLDGHPLIYFGGFAKHIGLYATPVGHEAFAEEFAQYKQGKGSVQFPLTDPLPVELVRRVIEHRIKTVSDELPKIGSPATRALASIGVTRRSQLAEYTAEDMLALHGFGPKAIRILRDAGVQLKGETLPASSR